MLYYTIIDCKEIICSNFQFKFNGIEIYKYKAKYSEINAASLCLGNISKDFLTDNWKRNWIIQICL